MEFGLESLPMLLVIAFCIFLLGNDGGDGDSIDDGSGGDDGDDDVLKSEEVPERRAAATSHSGVNISHFKLRDHVIYCRCT